MKDQKLTEGENMIVTKEDFKNYVAVQKSGITNMWAINTVQEITGMEKEKILDIMGNYGKYKKKYL